MTATVSIVKVLLIPALVLAAPVVDAEAQTKSCGSEIKAIEINEATLHYVECGQGEALVFVHGSLGDLHVFRAQVEAFAGRYRVIANSRRYHAPNVPPGPTDSNPLGRHVADLATLLKKLKAAPAHLVGHSYGGYIALALAVEQPDAVRSVVLGEPPVLPLLSRTSVGESVRESWMSRVIAPARKAFEAGDMEDGLRKFLDGVRGAGCHDKRPQAERTQLVERQAPAFRLELQTDGPAYMPALAGEDLGRLKRRTLLLTGERSHAMFLLINAELERCLEGASQVMVPDAGHGLQHDNPAFFNKALAAFLERR